jgi:hypothetical protein
VFNYKFSITKFRVPESTHGKHSNIKQRRTQESKTHGAQEEQNRESIEAPRVRSRIEETQSEEAGARHVEEVRAALGI